MAAATILSPTTRRGLQFSLGGMMFIFVFGVSIGLAYSRLPLASFTDGLFASFIVWFLLGTGQRLWRDLHRIRHLSASSPEERWGAVLQIATSVGIILLVVIAAGVHDFCRRGSATGIAWNGRPGAFAAGNILFFLAIMGAYWSPPMVGTSSSGWLRIIHPVRDVAFIGIASFWAAQAFITVVPVLQLVHIAIRGVESYQPTRWAGRLFYPFQLRPPSTDRLFTALLAAFALVASATAVNALLLRYWRRGWVLRCLLVCLAAPCLLIALRLVNWCLRTGLPEVSPFWAAAIDEVTLGARPLYALLVVVLGATIAMASTVVKASDDRFAQRAAPPRRAALIHEHSALAALCIFAVVSGVVTQIWKQLMEKLPPDFDWLSARLLWWSAVETCQEYLLGYSDQMIGLAAVVVLVGYLFRRWRGAAEESETWLVRPGEFVATWLICVITIALLIPIIACGAFVAALANMPAYY